MFSCHYISILFSLMLHIIKMYVATSNVIKGVGTHTSQDLT